MSEPVQMHRACTVYGHGRMAKSTFYGLARKGRITLFRVGGCTYIAEDFPTLIRRIAAEDAATESTRGKAAREVTREAARRKRMATAGANSHAGEAA
jgi:hypothetical protein